MIDSFNDPSIHLSYVFVYRRCIVVVVVVIVVGIAIMIMIMVMIMVTNTAGTSPPPLRKSGRPDAWTP